MKANENTLKLITNDVKTAIISLDVVTPSIYDSLFSKFSISNDVDIDNENKITNDLLDEKITIFTHLQEKTSTNAQKLSDNTDKAINAIKDKDDKILNEVLHETQILKKELEKLKEAVYKDELTHALNRKWLYDNLLNHELNKFKETGFLAMIDLNYFKIINDTYGHVIGDKVLIFIANQLKKTKEHVIRYGGDEFIIIFSNSNTYKSAISKLNDIREDILSKSLKAKDASFKVSFSLGVCNFTKDDTLEEIIAKADEHMYTDKLKIKKRITGI